MGSEWIWKKLPVDEDRMKIIASYDHDESTISSADFLLGIDDNPPSKWSGEAVLRVKYYKLHKVEALHMLPAVASCMLVDDSIAKVILDFVPDDEIMFYPATVKATDGETHKFKLVVPLVLETCIDISKCTGVRHFLNDPEKDVSGYWTAEHFPDCLGDRHIVRDDVYPGYIVVSDALKQALEATQEPGLNFKKIEEITDVGLYQRKPD